MSKQVSNIPTRMTAGLNAAWSDAPVGYPSSEYQLKYVLVNENNRIEITADAAATGFSVTKTATQTGSWIAGTYRMIGYAEKNGEKFEVYNGSVVVEKSPFGTGGVDYRTHAEICLAAIQATIQGRATKEQSELMIGQRMIKLMPLRELIEAESHFKWQVRQEQNVRLGLDNTIKVQFK